MRRKLTTTLVLSADYDEDIRNALARDTHKVLSRYLQDAARKEMKEDVRLKLCPYGSVHGGLTAGWCSTSPVPGTDCDFDYVVMVDKLPPGVSDQQSLTRWLLKAIDMHLVEDVRLQVSLKGNKDHPCLQGTLWLDNKQLSVDLTFENTAGVLMADLCKSIASKDHRLRRAAQITKTLLQLADPSDRKRAKKDRNSLRSVVVVYALLCHQMREKEMPSVPCV